MSANQVDMFGEFEKIRNCPMCKRNLPINDKFWYFHKSGRHKGYTQPRCKSCMKAASVEEHTDNKARRQTQSEWRDRNRGLIAQINEEWRENNRDDYNEYHREYSKGYLKTEKGKEIRRNAQRNRRAKLETSEGTHTVVQIRDLLSAQDSYCAYCKCGIEDSYHVDHMRPIAKSGSNDIYNLIITCPTCNLSKGDRDLDDWLASKDIDHEKFFLWLDGVQSRMTAEI